MNNTAKALKRICLCSTDVEHASFLLTNFLDSDCIQDAYFDENGVLIVKTTDGTIHTCSGTFEEQAEFIENLVASKAN